MTAAELLAFMRSNRLAVHASVSPTGSPQAAVIGVVVTDAFEAFFDTLDRARKAHNLRRNARVVFVIGGLTDGDESTVQHEGIADEPTDVRVRPTWIRYSNFSQTPPQIEEFEAGQLRT